MQLKNDSNPLDCDCLIVILYASNHKITKSIVCFSSFFDALTEQKNLLHGYWREFC